MTDSKLKSITESLANIAFGYPINHFFNIVILLPYAPILAESATKNGYLAPETQLIIASMGMLYTVVSIVRSYALRRFFEHFGEHENAYTLLVRLKKWISAKI